MPKRLPGAPLLIATGVWVAACMGPANAPSSVLPTPAASAPAGAHPSASPNKSGLPFVSRSPNCDECCDNSCFWPIAGRVVDDQGRSVEGAVVTGRFSGGGRFLNNDATITVAANHGYFVINGAEAGYAVALTASAPGYREVTQSRTVMAIVPKKQPTYDNDEYVLNLANFGGLGAESYALTRIAAAPSAAPSP